jgi:uncharacterized protein YcnI
MKKQIAVFMVLLMCFGACQSTVVTKGSYIRLVKPEKGAITADPSNISVFYKKNPDFKYTEIGIVEAVAKGSQAGLEDLFIELRKQAATLGATAIYKIEIQRHDQTEESLHATAIAIINAPE